MKTNISNKIQIGVMGSMSDTKLKNIAIKTAKNLGKEIAKSGSLLVFGYEGDFESLPEIAAKSAEKHNGQTLAFLWGNNNSIKNINSIAVRTGQLRGGGREFPLILSCDAIITIGGGSGTLTEIAMAYQANIPVVSIEKSGGWSDKLAGKFLDDRKRQKVHIAKNAKEAIALAIKLTK